MIPPPGGVEITETERRMAVGGQGEGRHVHQRQGQLGTMTRRWRWAHSTVKVLTAAEMDTDAWLEARILHDVYFTTIRRKDEAEWRGKPGVQGHEGLDGGWDPPRHGRVCGHGRDVGCSEKSRGGMGGPEPNIT